MGHSPRKHTCKKTRSSVFTTTAFIHHMHQSVEPSVQQDVCAVQQGVDRRSQVRIFSSAHHMLKFLAADLVHNNTDPTKFYTDLYGGCTCAHAFVAMRFEGPDEATL